MAGSKVVTEVEGAEEGADAVHGGVTGWVKWVWVERGAAVRDGMQ